MREADLGSGRVSRIASGSSSHSRPAGPATTTRAPVRKAAARSKGVGCRRDHGGHLPCTAARDRAQPGTTCFRVECVLSRAAADDHRPPHVAWHAPSCRRLTSSSLAPALPASAPPSGSPRLVRACSSSRSAGGWAAVRPHFADPQSGEVVDNGQHVLFGCYHETFAFLERHRRGQRRDARLDAGSRNRRSLRPALAPATRLRLPPPFHLIGGLLRWPALGMRDRLAALRLGLVLRRLHRERQADARAKARANVGDAQAKAWAYVRDGASADPSYVDPSFSSGIKIGGTVAAWLTANGQTPRLHEVLWEPLAVAALNQSPAVASAGPFIEVSLGCSAAARAMPRSGCPRRPLDRLFAEPAPPLSRGSTVMPVRCGLPARVVARRRSCGGCGSSRRAHHDRRGHFHRALVRVRRPSPRTCQRSSPSSSNAARMTSSPIVTVNLWLDGPVAKHRSSAFPGRRFQWMFDKARLFGEQRVACVARRQRRGRDRRLQ